MSDRNLADDEFYYVKFYDSEKWEVAQFDSGRFYRCGSLGGCPPDEMKAVGKRVTMPEEFDVLGES